MTLKISNAPESILAGRSLLFVGNGPYRNRGCEAIVRGTMEILSETFGSEISARAGVMASPATVSAQQAQETDRRIRNFSISHVGPRLSPKWWMSQANARLSATFAPHVSDLREPMKGVACALQLGGDNYSLDYGRPRDYMAIDRELWRQGVPVVLWGASVGPFEKDADFAPAIFSHLKKMSGIFVRETASRDYLSENGVTENVRLVADPAFCMRPSVPDEATVRNCVMPGMIGINVSPLVARFSHTYGDLSAWRDHVAEMVVEAVQETGRPILLVPHVGWPTREEDDFSFMEEIAAMAGNRVTMPIRVAPATLGAAELKWLISQCTVFAGARTHSTIAALSSCTPTLTLSYSVKAVGINQDIFGHQDFCKPVKTISVEDFAVTLRRILEDAEPIRAGLEAKMPEIKVRAQCAGMLLAELLENQQQ